MAGWLVFVFFFFFNDTATTEIYTLSLHDALPIPPYGNAAWLTATMAVEYAGVLTARRPMSRSEEHTSELQSRGHLVCRLLLEKKKQSSYAGVYFQTQKKKTTRK